MAEQPHGPSLSEQEILLLGEQLLARLSKLNKQLAEANALYSGTHLRPLLQVIPGGRA